VLLSPTFLLEVISLAIWLLGLQLSVFLVEVSSSAIILIALAKPIAYGPLLEG
jgi:hypothetical protein